MPYSLARFGWSSWPNVGKRGAAFCNAATSIKAPSGGPGAGARRRPYQWGTVTVCGSPPAVISSIVSTFPFMMEKGIVRISGCGKVKLTIRHSKTISSPQCRHKCRSHPPNSCPLLRRRSSSLFWWHVSTLFKKFQLLFCETANIMSIFFAGPERKKLEKSLSILSYNSISV